MISRMARPIVAFARLPEPKALAPPFMPISRAIGPLTITNGEAMWVVACTPLRLNGWSVRASMAARTTGAYSGLQPAMTMLMARTSRVSAPQRGAALHSTKSGSPPRARTTALILSWVGGTTGRPSVQPRSKYRSAKSASAISRDEGPRSIGVRDIRNPKRPPAKDQCNKYSGVKLFESDHRGAHIGDFLGCKLGALRILRIWQRRPALVAAIREQSGHVHHI